MQRGTGSNRTRDGGAAQGRAIDPERFDQLVARITADEPLTDAAFVDLLDAPDSYACASELDVIWHVTGTLKPPPST